MKTLALMFTFALYGAAQNVAQPAIASNPVVTVEGKIQKVQIARGQGMPFIELQSVEGTIKVYLGPVRFLMEQDFNPKAGMQISVKGYNMNPDVVAISVTIPAEKKTLKLRDDKGWPVWRGGVMGHGMMRSEPAKP
jgi:hypothetical protein